MPRNPKWFDCQAAVPVPPSEIEDWKKRVFTDLLNKSPPSATSTTIANATIGIIYSGDTVVFGFTTPDGIIIDCFEAKVRSHLMEPL